MNTRRALKSALVALTLLVMLISTAACTTTQAPAATSAAATSASVAATSQAAEATPEQTATAKPAPAAVTLQVMTSTPPKLDFATTAVGQQIKKLLNITVENVVADDAKTQLLLASNDLPDIPMLDADKYQASAIEGNNLLALDDLVASNGADITKTVPKTVDFSKKFLSDKTGKLYFLPTNAGPDMMGFKPSVGFTIRWDYYKDLGFPAINNEYDLLNVLKQMVDAHPKTDDGKPVYGVGGWGADWVLWTYYMPMASVYGYNNFGHEGYMYKCDTNEILNNYLDVNSPLWKTVAFFNKANQMGIFDPDTFTMKFPDFQAKATAGQELYAAADWGFGDVNGKLQDDGKGSMTIPKGFMTIPLEWGYQFQGADQIGRANACYAISTNCKTPDRAMDLLNYLWSYDGSRLATSGVEGQTWNMVNGVPTPTDQYLKDRAAENDAFKQTGVRQTDIGIMCGLGQWVVNPADSTEIDLTQSKGVFAAQTETSGLWKAYCQQYGVTYPAEIFLKNLQAGKSINQSKMDVRIPSAVAVAPDNIKTIDTNLDELMLKAVVKLVLAKSDDEFNTLKTQTLADLKAAGADTSNEWWTKAWADARAAVGN